MNKDKSSIILAIESSCDETAAAVLRDGDLLSNVIATQEVHAEYGGVVPELASREHQKNIVPVVDQALKQANVTRGDIDGIAFTKGPGLLGSLLVGTSFAKALSLGLNIPLIEINHMQAHVLAHFIDKSTSPKFPFLCLTVSGGHTQIVLVKSYFKMELVGQSIDDAAGEAFDKAAKILGLPYPGGPLIDKYAMTGDTKAFKFTKPKVPNLDFSFSGLKTGFMNFVKNGKENNPRFVEENLHDICASIQHTIIEILLDKLLLAAKQNNIDVIAIAGGVSANNGLRAALEQLAEDEKWELHVPKFEYCTDNAAMIGIAGYYKYAEEQFTDLSVIPQPRYAVDS